MDGKVQKNEQEWKKQLTPNQYYVTREKGTEPPFTGEYEGTKASGTYQCVCCGQPLFRSETKFASGSGWPSFCAPAEEQAVEKENDMSRQDALRTEVRMQRAARRTWDMCSMTGQNLRDCGIASIPRH